MKSVEMIALGSQLYALEGNRIRTFGLSGVEAPSWFEAGQVLAMTAFEDDLVLVV